VHTDALYYVHADHLGTPLQVLDQANQLRWRWDPAPFGETAAEENPSGLGVFELNLRFPGQYFDKETNLHYNMARDYSPQEGRYIQSDPIGLDGGINTYLYVGANPLVAFDPFGLSPCRCVADDNYPKAHNADRRWWTTKHEIICRYKCSNTDGSSSSVLGTHYQTDFLNMDSGQFGDCRGAVFSDFYLRGDPYRGIPDRFVKRRQRYDPFDPEGSGVSDLERWAKDVCDKCTSNKK